MYAIRSYYEHPFWRNSFVITDPKDIERIRVSRIREVRNNFV